ncbi:MAG: DUF1786 family protein [Chloroflexia bacterium]
MGPSSDAVALYSAGLAVASDGGSAKTLHDNPRRVEALGGAEITEEQPEAVPVVLSDLDPAALRETL